MMPIYEMLSSFSLLTRAVFNIWKRNLKNVLIPVSKATNCSAEQILPVLHPLQIALLFEKEYLNLCTKFLCRVTAFFLFDNREQEALHDNITVASYGRSEMSVVVTV